eukprot:PhM_4_TR3515/c0_g1_i1/m.42192
MPSYNAEIDDHVEDGDRTRSSLMRHLTSTKSCLLISVILLITLFFVMHGMPSSDSGNIEDEIEPISKSGFKGICIFDIDCTLNRMREATAETCGLPKGTKLPSDPVCYGCVGLDPPKRREMAGNDSFVAPFAKKAIDGCLERGLDVAISTARACDGPIVPRRLDYLKRLGLPERVVRPDGSRGPNFMCPAIQSRNNSANKFTVLDHQLKLRGIPYHRAIFFDDSGRARDGVQTHLPELNFQLASPNCEGKWCVQCCGVTEQVFKDGMAKIERYLNDDKEAGDKKVKKPDDAATTTPKPSTKSA